MLMAIPNYILRRLAQTNVKPAEVYQSTPVLGFGNFFTASVATLGLNPSCSEFTGRNKQLLPDTKRRLETLPSLGLTDYSDAGLVEYQKTLDACLNYFEGQNPYFWFKRFAPVLQRLGVSYESGTACHLDLFQTATNPVWAKLKKEERTHYLDSESWFFEEQLKNHDIETILLNGKTVVNTFCKKLGITLTVSKHTGKLGQSFEFFKGNVQFGSRTIEVRGWNINIQSSHIKNGAPVTEIADLC